MRASRRYRCENGSCRQCAPDLLRGIDLGKLIAKTAAITFACIIVLALVLFGIFSLFVPSVMVALTDSLGMTGACAYYSVAQYEKSGDISDLADAVSRSYEAEHYEDVAEYGIILRMDAGYDEYCAQRDAERDFTGSLGGLLGTADQFFAGITAESQYRSGETQAALDTAFESIGASFDDADAVTYVAGAAIEAEDAACCGQILSRLDELSAEGNAFDEDLHEDLKEFKDMLREAA